MVVVGIDDVTVVVRCVRSCCVGVVVVIIDDNNWLAVYIVCNEVRVSSSNSTVVKCNVLCRVNIIAIRGVTIGCTVVLLAGVYSTVCGMNGICNMMGAVGCSVDGNIVTLVSGVGRVAVWCCHVAGTGDNMAVVMLML